jgi:hypothetical protein
VIAINRLLPANRLTLSRAIADSDDTQPGNNNQQQQHRKSSVAVVVLPTQVAGKS